MNKETLIKIKEEIIDLLYKAEIDKFDKTELMINLTKILDNYDECIAYADSTIALQNDFVDAWYNKGIAYLNKAVISQEVSTKDTKNPDYVTDKLRTQEFYRQARPCMEMVRKLQPDRQERWASPLYRIYLNLNLGDEFSEIERLLNSKS